MSLGGGVLGEAATSHVAWAIAAGLVIGKVVGITGATLLALRLGWGNLPEGVEPRHIVGLAAIAGIGFTVSLFITQLAFVDPDVVNTTEIGILAGSALSGMAGAILLSRAARPRAAGRA